ncbi:MAG: histidinol dehydrogenase, partial [Cardiobacterium sp.]
MQSCNWNTLDAAERRRVLTRPAQQQSAAIRDAVAAIYAAVLADGDAALRRLTAQFDGVNLDALTITPAARDAAAARVPATLQAAMRLAKDNIETFHRAQQPPVIDLETRPGVRCQVITRPIERVGLYIPGGSAPLFSTVLMLAVPARLAGCRHIALCTPPPVADEILCAAALCGIDPIPPVGGAQA